MEEKQGKKWLRRILDFINPLRDPSLTVAAVLTFIEEAGQHDIWYIIILIALVNWVAVRGVVWLVVNFTFATTFVSRRLWWAIRHPRLAWRIMDAIGHEEIIIGGIQPLTEGMLLPEGGSTISSVFSTSGFHVIGELPAGTEVPMLGMPNGQMAPDFSMLGNSGFFPMPNGESGSQSMFTGQPTMSFSQAAGNGYVNQQQSTDGLPQSFPQRPSQQEEQMRQQLAAYARLLDDWIQYTEEKWRTVSDSQLGWKPLRGRWGNWDDIFQDVYAAKTSDPMASAAQAAGDATMRRFDTSKEKGSAASAVACFMRDMMTLRRGMELLQQNADHLPETPDAQPTVQPLSRSFGRNNSGNLYNGGGTVGSNTSPRSSLIRRPAQIFVDADAEK